MEKPRKTKTGNYVTNEETLLPLRSLHPVVALILDYREARKLLNTYIDPLPKMCYPDGKLHTSYNLSLIHSFCHRKRPGQHDGRLRHRRYLDLYEYRHDGVDQSATRC